MNPREQCKLRIRLLGGISLRYGEKEISDKDNRSKKLWLLLAYIITFRNRKLTQDDFMELLWPKGQSSNPGNALKTLFHRVRSMLNNLGYMSGHSMVLQDNGSYSWNNRLSFSVDIDEFERVVKEGEETEDQEEKLRLYLSAMDIYRGDFLPMLATEAWVVPISAHYHSVYVRLVHETLQLLIEAQEYDEVVARAGAAVAIEPYDEYIYYNLILALVRLGEQSAALAQYEKMTELFFNNFGVAPSEEMTTLYNEVVRTTNSMETDLNLIKRHLREPEAHPGAFFCEYEFFKSIYRLYARALDRTGQAIYIGLITLSGSKGGKLGTKILSNAMKKLDACIRFSLRQGDVYAKYSLSQYIIMLPSANYENGRQVMSRVTGRFRRENPHSQAMINYTLTPLDPLTD